MADLVTHLAKMVREQQPAKEVDDWYACEVFPASVPVVVRESRRALGNREYCLEILTVGETPYPLIHSILTLQPTQVLLIHTKETLQFAQAVEAGVKQHAAQVGAEVLTFEQREVDRVESERVYEAIREVMGDRSTGVAVDITGGTKAMVGGAAQAAALLGADVVYVEAPPLEEPIRGEARKKRIYRVHPGRERVHLLENPYKVFGDLDEQHALSLFEQHRYSAAAEVLNRIALTELGTTGNRYRLEYWLATGYGHAEAMDFSSAADALGQARVLAGQLRGRPSCPKWLDAECFERIRDQALLAQCLCDRLPKKPTESALALLQDAAAFRALWSFIYNYALRRADVGQYDMSALATYRCLELIPQRRLAVRGIRTDKPKYQDLAKTSGRFADVEELAAAFHAWPEPPKTDEGTCEVRLPKELACRDGLRMLLVIEDETAAAIGDLDQQSHLAEETISRAAARNKSILAHGVARISRRQYEQLQSTVDTWAQAMCAAEGWDWDELQTAFCFITL
ncbi:MAG: TIGR02710 family CRISPR-associated CARF protein [Armatimonadota bacterium]